MLMLLEEMLMSEPAARPARNRLAHVLCAGGLFLLLALLPISTASAAVTWTVDASTSDGSPLTAVTVGTQIVLDITLRSDDFAFGVAGSVNDYDNTIVELDAGSSLLSPNVFNAFCASPTTCFGGLTNMIGSAITFAERSVGPGVEAEFLAALGLSQAGGQGSLDPGVVTGVAGDPQFRIVFTAISEGETTLQIGTYPEYQDGYVGSVDEIANNVTLTISVGGTDTDGDGLSDPDELNIYLTDPLVADTDGDGLSDGEEVLDYLTNPLVVDTDGDGLSDSDEVLAYFTNPLVSDASADTDGDGLSNVDEADRYFTNPQAADATADTDGDGLSNVEEADLYFTDPQTADAGTDTDGDGLTNVSEIEIHATNPTLPDTDEDGLGDGEEVLVTSTDPLAPNPLTSSLNTNAATDSGADRFVAIETDGFGSWVTAWPSDDDLSGTIGTDFDILTARSSDGGATWSAPTALNTNAATDGDDDSGPPALGTDGSGVWIAAWPSLSDLGGTIGTDRDILFARSTDGGATWSDPSAIDVNALFDSGEDDRVALAYGDGDGVFVALWQSENGTFGSDFDIKMSRSTDGGQTWSAAVFLNTNPGGELANDTGPTLASDGLGSWVAVWESDESLVGGEGDLFVARSSDGAASWTSTRILNTNALFDLGSDERPRITTDGLGTWLLVWDSDDDLGGTIGADRDVLFSRSTDNGARWTAPAALDATALSDTGDDIHPDPASDTTGGWTVVWESNEDLGGLLGTDSDLLVSRSTDAATSWAPALSLKREGASDLGGDHFPRIATQPAGSTLVAWHSDDGASGTGSDLDLFVLAGLFIVDSDDDGLSDADETNRYGTDPLVADAGTDSDGDGLTNVAEVDVHSTDPQLADSDGDGLSDGDEVDLHATDPLSVDTDGDGLSDGDEILLYFLDPVVADADADTDGDGLSNVSEVDLYFTDPLVADASADTDGDGLRNVDEVDLYFLDPQTPDAGADTDGDGLSNVEEVELYLLDPQLADAGADTDGDGLSNVSEVDLYRTDPGVADLGADTDGDGLSNVDEVDLYATDPTQADSDGDGLSDGEEVDIYSTDPLSTDTDGDGRLDGDEVNVTMTDPLVPDPPDYVLNSNADVDSGSDVFTSIETDGFGNWVAVWQSSDDLDGTIGPDSDILTARSTNDGASWTPPAPLNTNAATDGAGDAWPPVVVTNRTGVWITVWASESDLDGTIGTDRDVLFARSTDRGTTWTDPLPIDVSATSDSGADDRVTLGYGGGVFIALWESVDEASGPDVEIKMSRSTNGGQTWSPAILLSSNGGNDGWPSVASDGMGNWVAVWESDESLLGGDGDLFATRSSDAGNTWTTPAILNSNALSDVGSDLRPRVATDGFGVWLVVWDSDDDLGTTIGTDRDILFVRSLDNGASWSTPAALDLPAAATDVGDEINADPATDLTGSWTVVWESNEDVGGVLGVDFDVLAARSSDHGVTWSSAFSITPEAETDLGGDFFPRIATQPAGPSIAIWHSDEDAGSAVGTDWDLFVANDLTSSTVQDCGAIGPFPQSTPSLGVAEHHYCEDWALVSQPGADLRDSFLAKIDLSGATLNGGLLLRSDLSGADLSNASLFNAELGQAILAGADLTSSDLSFAGLGGAFYDQHTLFPSGGNLESGSWGLPDDVAPWDLGMVPVPEPSFGWLLLAGSVALIGRARRRNSR